MDAQSNIFRFDQAVSALPGRLREALTGLPAAAKCAACEVRLRVDKPMMLCCPNQNWFVDTRSQLHNLPSGCFAVTPDEISSAVLGLCSYSVHAHEGEMKNGFISLRGGHRAGVCGTAVIAEGRVSAVREVTSVNIRIARDLRGAADELMRHIFERRIEGVLVAGPPSSGKTTILRDLARQLSGGRLGQYLKVAVIDERFELAAVSGGVPQNDLGPACDILSGYPKGEGVMTAVRTLSPQVIICDEIGGGEDVTSMLDGLRCGVKMIASAHAESVDELLGKRQVTRLLREGAFGAIVMLGGADKPGSVTQILRTEELCYENGRFVTHRPLLYHDGRRDGVELVGEGTQA